MSVVSLFKLQATTTSTTGLLKLYQWFYPWSTRRTPCRHTDRPCMTPQFCWPKLHHDLALAKEVAGRYPSAANSQGFQSSVLH